MLPSTLNGVTWYTHPTRPGLFRRLSTGVYKRVV